ncbi:MAG: nitroreductase [Ruminococcaceae bacterium]|nr:nitroreductase [Oscillospiraceae bacterium]
MNSLLYQQIFKRKSFHLFRNCGESTISAQEINDILQEFQNFSVLDATIRTAIRVLPSSETSCKRGQEYCILLYSEKKPNYLQNIGYIGEQLDLYLTSRNIGALWFGIGKTEEVRYDGLDFVIMLAIRKINDETKFRKDMFKSKRKGLHEIWDGEVLDGVSELVRFAPSACNTQPWFVKREENFLKVFRYKKLGKRGIMPAARVSFYNRIDIGIFLCFLELCLENMGYSFTRSLHVDEGNDDELTLNAEYIFE